MVIFYRFLVVSSLLVLSFSAFTQESCPSFKHGRRSAQRSSKSIVGIAKCSFENWTVVTSKPIDFLPMMVFGGETAFLRHFAVGYNFGFTVKRESRNYEVGHLDGLLVRPELRYYFSKAFNGYWMGYQNSIFFQNTGFKDGLVGLQFGKAQIRGRRLAVNSFIGWATSQQVHTVGLGFSIGFLVE